MATKTPILTDKAPKPLPGIYSQAIVSNGVVYCSGAVPMDPETGKIIDGDIKAHTVSNPLPLLLKIFVATQQR
jgi:enamine deaminase RidA (YjgF/YER057c/UK114 family)